ncbi:MAG: hypothetical protein U0359_27320 [Byssovorax sp.]
MNHRGLALLSLALLTGCSAAPPAPAPAPSAALTVDPAASTSPVAAPASTAGATARAEAPPAPTAARAETPPAPPDSPGPAPLTEDEQKEAERRCKPLTAIVQKAKGTGKTPLDALDEALKKPPASMKRDDVERCGTLMRRGIETYLAAAREVEAQVVLKRITLGMVSAYQSNGAFCPATDHPVPADKALVAREPYVSTAADWSGPSWKCLGIELTAQAQRFQYEVSVDPGAKSFSIVARGVPGGNGHWVTLVQRGKVGPKEIEIGPIERGR